MREKLVVAVYDTVSETIISEFIANNLKVAEKAFKNFIEKEKLENQIADFRLIVEAEFDSLVCPEDVDNFCDDNVFCFKEM